MRKVYGFINSRAPEWYTVSAVADDGHCLAQHISSSPAFARVDIQRHGAHFDTHCGAGRWEFEWVEEIKSHPGLVAALELNRALGEAAKATKEAACAV